MQCERKIQRIGMGQDSKSKSSDIHHLQSNSLASFPFTRANCDFRFPYLVIAKSGTGEKHLQAQLTKFEQMSCTMSTYFEIAYKQKQLQTVNVNALEHIHSLAVNCMY